MQFRIADTFRDSLAKLNGEEQKAAKTTAFDLQMNPANPGLKFHRLSKVKDPHFWSVRVNRDVRLIVHKTDANFCLCYVDHHDPAYDWAARRKLETHPRTGAAQFVEIREKVVEVPVYVQVEQPKPRLFEHVPVEDLLSYGVPQEWIDDVHLANEDTLFEITDHLPAEAAEALIELATGNQPKLPEPVAEAVEPFAHPDAQRRFRLVTNVEELERALEAPWEKWAVFLHPAQRDLVEREQGGPARVAGSAGTGKTVVALHRAAHLARTNPDARLLLTTFTDTLAGMLERKLRLLVPEAIDRITVATMPEVARRLYRESHGEPNLADESTLRELISEGSKTAGPHKFTDRFLWAEWTEVVDAWQLSDWESYRDVQRLGRKTRLGENQRRQLWTIFEHVRVKLDERGLLTVATLLDRVRESVDPTAPPFDFAIVDEAQDVGVPELRLLAAIGAERPNALFFAGDLGQRIFQTPFSWKSLGVDVRGRSRTLRVNYRTSHQIRSSADRLLGVEVTDVDGNSDDRRGTISAFEGPEPTVTLHANDQAETAASAAWLTELIADGVAPTEIGIVVRSPDQLPRATRAVESAGLTPNELRDSVDLAPDHVAVLVMHLAKGLEFRAVLVMACDDEVIPLQERIRTSATTRTWRRSTTPNATSSTSHARGPVSDLR